MYCPTCSCLLDLDSLAFKWLGRTIEASATYSCPKCRQLFVKIGNRLTKVTRREIAIEQ